MFPKLLFHLVLLGALISCASLDKATKSYTPKEEYYLGRSVIASSLSQAKFLEGEINIYPNQIVQYLAYWSARPTLYKGYRVGIIDDPSPIAFSSPGGHILLSTGLLRMVESEDQLAAILAHEIVHVEKSHAVEAIRRSGKSELAINAGLAVVGFFTQNQDLRNAMDHYDELVGEYTEMLIHGKYDKDQELEADQGALTLLNKAGYTAGELRHLLEKMVASQGQKGGGWLDHHPADEQRLILLPKTSKPSGNRLQRFNIYKKKHNLL